MPRKTDSIPIQDKFLDRRIKLLPCQKESMHRLHVAGHSIGSIAKMFKVSKRLVQFELFPERKKLNVELLQARGGSKIYYNREKHTAAIRDHRNYKKQLFTPP